MAKEIIKACGAEVRIVVGGVAYDPMCREDRVYLRKQSSRSIVTVG